MEKGSIRSATNQTASGPQSPPTVLRTFEQALRSRKSSEVHAKKRKSLELTEWSHYKTQPGAKKMVFMKEKNPVI